MNRIPRGPPQCSSHVSAMPAHVRRCTRLAGVSLANVSPFFVKAASPPYSIVFGGGSPRYAVNRLPVTRDSCAQDQPRDSCAAVTAGADQQNVSALHITSHCQKLIDPPYASVWIQEVEISSAPHGASPNISAESRAVVVSTYCSRTVFGKILERRGPCRGISEGGRSL
jgi:hypothetical protein